MRCHVSVCNNADLPNAVCADMPPPWCRSVVGTSMAEYKDAVHDAEQFILHDVEMFNGERWGTCRACSLKAKRNRFGACSDHFNLKCHTEAVAWFKRKLESSDGLSFASGSSSGQNVNCSSNVDMQVFLPHGDTEKYVDGVIVMDSFYYMKSRNGRLNYLPDLLTQLREEFGLVVMAVCSGGAALSNPGHSGAFYDQLLDRVGVRKVGFMIAIVCGND